MSAPTLSWGEPPVVDFASEYLTRLNKALDKIDREQLNSALSQVKKAWSDGRQIITLGNGGSAMTALHFITDWNKMVFLATGKPFRGRTLLDNMGMLTAYANDMSYADVFSEQIKNVAVAGDLVIAISGSGNSENVIRAVEAANQMGCVTLGLCGFSGGRLKQVAHSAVWVPVDDMQLCEDAHSIFGHIVMQFLCGVPKVGSLSPAGANAASPTGE